MSAGLPPVRRVCKLWMSWTEPAFNLAKKMAGEGYSGTQISVAIWDRASHDPVFAAEQHRWVTECLRTIANAVSARNSDREDCEEVAQLLGLPQARVA